MQCAPFAPCPQLQRPCSIGHALCHGAVPPYFAVDGGFHQRAAQPAPGQARELQSESLLKMPYLSRKKAFFSFAFLLPHYSSLGIYERLHCSRGTTNLPSRWPTRPPAPGCPSGRPRLISTSGGARQSWFRRSRCKIWSRSTNGMCFPAAAPRVWCAARFRAVTQRVHSCRSPMRTRKALKQRLRQTLRSNGEGSGRGRRHTQQRSEEEASKRNEVKVTNLRLRGTAPLTAIVVTSLLQRWSS